MTLRLACIVSLALLGCGGAKSAEPRAVEPSTPQSGSSAGSAGQTGARTVRPPNEAACAPTYAAARAMPSGCVAADHAALQCAYAEGDCWCGNIPICSGAERDPAEEPPPTWVCRDASPAIRPDGCPGLAPSAGAVCDAPGRECQYGDCGGVVMRCEPDGHWEVARMIDPPA